MQRLVDGLPVRLNDLNLFSIDNAAGRSRPSGTPCVRSGLSNAAGSALNPLYCSASLLASTFAPSRPARPGKRSGANRCQRSLAGARDARGREALRQENGSGAPASLAAAGRASTCDFTYPAACQDAIKRLA